MKNIHVGFSKGAKPSLVGAIIMRVMKAPYSHTYIRLLETNTVFEAEWVGTRVMSYESWLKESVVVEEIKIQISDERYDELTKFVKANQGIPHGFAQLFRILLIHLSRVVKIDNGAKAYIYSELVARSLADILMIEDDKLDTITPKMIYNIIKEMALSQSVKAW